METAKQAIDPIDAPAAPITEYRARKPFTYQGREIQRGDSIAISDPRRVRSFIAARLIADPLGVA